jgi:periplasmic divalent cation tolerance protein
VSQGQACILYLSCKDEQEAGSIAEALLKEKLIACASVVPAKSWFAWKDQLEANDETLMIMKSRTDMFAEVEDQVKELHSYETFVLEMTKVEAVSSKATDWLQQTLRK